MDIVASMVAMKSSTSFVLLQYPIMNALLSYGTILNTIRMKPLPMLVAQYLTWPKNNLGIGLGFLHASTPHQSKDF